VTYRVAGNCRFTSGMPVTQVVRARLETDGLEARITYAVSGTSAPVGMQCRIPGGGGNGISMPIKMSGDGQAEPTVLKLQDGAEMVTDLATTPGAAVMAQGGARLTGESRFRLVLDCPAK